MYPDPTRAQRLFAEQFEPNGEGYLYRRSRKAAGIRVTSEERDRFVREFVDKLRGSQWVLYAATGILMIGLVVLAKSRSAISLSSVPSLIGIVAAALVLSIPYAARCWWIFGAPARELRGRAPVVAKRSPEEIRDYRLEKLTWGHLGLATLVSAFLALPRVRREQLFPGWNHFAFWTAMVLFVLVAIQAFRKWRFDRRNDGR